jgi:hypothetical protein
MSACSVGERVRRLSAVLADINFPAMKWEIVVHAEFVGADIRSRTELYHLPTRRYDDLASVISAIEQE